MNISTRGPRPWLTHRNHPGETAFIADSYHVLSLWTLALSVHRH
jgi:hypothetical protein